MGLFDKKDEPPTGREQKKLQVPAEPTGLHQPVTPTKPVMPPMTNPPRPEATVTGRVEQTPRSGVVSSNMNDLIERIEKQADSILDRLAGPGEYVQAPKRLTARLLYIEGRLNDVLNLL